MVAQHHSALYSVEAMTLLTDHAFPCHSHKGFGIGIMTAGAQRSWSGLRPVESAAGASSDWGGPPFIAKSTVPAPSTAREGSR